MKTLVASNQKGGVGKTNSIVHLAFDAAERGLRVAVIDLDPQANASYTLSAYATGVKASQLFGGDAGVVASATLSARDAEVSIALVESDAKLADIEKISIAEASQAFKRSLEAIETVFDLVLVDTAPSLGNGMVTALLAADYVLCPVEMEAYSIQGIKKMLSVISNVRRTNTRLQFIGMLPSKVDFRAPRHIRHLAALTEAYPQYVIDAPLGLRSGFAEALEAGYPVWTIKKTAARKGAKEVRALAEYVFNRMEIAQ